ncbi:endonuclease/exonuclease/phosphatase family protein [Riemerella columbina]|uniref:endonuclease/exonuclease/phosphatase family protein n=1 Tax=Riemerella columbina TaxID=103810 RepID=UPI0026709F9A|nr:endonuclease/exonuclease/phosphatase family protein [Riemerella columbina]WKS95279.1 endonuclease/exonuclease/phosphatase family protein [Riemerella columbina]
MFILRNLILIGHLILVLLIYATSLNAVVPPRFLPELNLLALAFPFMVVAHLLLCLFWLFKWRKRGLLFLLSSVLMITPIRRWVNYSPQQKVASSAYKILSFNIKNGAQGTLNIKNFIDDQDPDVVILQESVAYREKQERLPYRDKIDLLTFYSKTPILRSGRILEHEDNGYAAYIDTQINHQTVRIINIYLKPFELNKAMVKPSKNLDITEEKAKGLLKRFIPVFKAHQNQVEQIRKAVETSPYPVILGGDFNAVPNSYEYYHLTAAPLQDSFLAQGNGLGTSFHDYKIPIRIDYLLFSPKFEIQHFDTDRSRQISDHYPIIATFQLK